MLYLVSIVFAIVGAVLSWAGFCDAWLLFLPLVVIGFVADMVGNGRSEADTGCNVVRSRANCLARVNY